MSDVRVSRNLSAHYLSTLSFNSNRIGELKDKWFSERRRWGQQTSAFLKPI